MAPGGPSATFEPGRLYRLKIAVILNPNAAGARAGKFRTRLNRLLAEEAARQPGSQWEVFETGFSGHAVQIAAEQRDTGVDIIAAAGGDGTISQCASSLVNSRTALSVIPLGTGNDFARTLNISGIEHGVQTLFRGVRRATDVGTANGRYFVNVAGCGFDAAVARRTNEGYKHFKGAMAYLAAVVECLGQFRPVNADILLDGKLVSGPIMMCSVANARYFGGGMRIAPEAQIDDGMLDVCLIAGVGKLEFLAALPRVFNGSHVTHPSVTMHRCKQLTVSPGRSIPIFIDGEEAGITPVEFTVMPGALQVVMPQQLSR